jgi:hypothetical protein
MNNVVGTFWVDGGPHIPGAVELASPSFQLDLEGICVPQEHLDFAPGRVSISSDPAALAADYAPRTLLGDLDGGIQVSLLDAHMDLESNWLSPSTQRFSGSHYVLGARITGDDQMLRGIRWTWDISNPQAGWLSAATERIEEGILRGSLSPWSYQGQPGLQFEPSGPLELRVLRQGILSALSQLLILWTGRQVDAGYIEIQLEDNTWCEYGALAAEAGRLSRSRLLPLNQLTLQTFAHWLPKASVLEPLPYMASTRVDVLQVDAQAVTTALEGLHRRLHGNPRPFADLSVRSVRRAMKEAREAGVAALRKSGFTEEAIADDILRNALVHVDQPNYQQRLEQLVEPVHRVAPGLLGPDPGRWATTMKNIRNDESHQLLSSFYDDEVGRYIIASISGRWVLTLRILLEVVEPASLRKALAESTDYAFALANMDGERLWADFSCLDTFRTAGL